MADADDDRRSLRAFRLRLYAVKLAMTVLWPVACVLFAGTHPIWRAIRVVAVCVTVVAVPWPRLRPDGAIVAGATGLIGCAVAAAVVAAGVQTLRHPGWRTDPWWRVGFDQINDRPLKEAWNAIRDEWMFVEYEDFAHGRRRPGRPPHPTYVVAAAALIRAFGRPLVILGFFAAWTFGWMALWGIDPSGVGLTERPYAGDFMYLAANLIVANVPAEARLASPAAHAAAVAELLTSLFAAGALAGFLLTTRITQPMGGSPGDE